MAVTKEFLNQAYLAYFGRPIDPNGALFYAQPSMTEAQVVADFFNSAESQAMYGTTFDVAQVNKIYNVLFGRDGDVAGVTWWANEIVTGKIAPAAAAIAILNGAQGSDKVIVENKLAASAVFTTNLDTMPEIVGYSGDAANTVARDFLASITTTPATPAQVDAAIVDAVAANGGEEEVGDFRLTVGADYGTEFVGTANADTYKAVVEQNMFGGQVNTLASGDELDGKGGIDTLNAKITAGAFVTGLGPIGSMPIQPEIKNIEILNLEAVERDVSIAGVLLNSIEGGNTPVYVNAKDIVGATNVNSLHSDADLTILNMTTQGLDKLSDLTIGMKYTGNADTRWGASDMTVYFDQDYLTPESTRTNPVVDILAMNEDAYDETNGELPLAGVFFRELTITVNGVRYDLTEYMDEDPAGAGEEITTYEEFLLAVQNALVDLKADNASDAALQTVEASLGTEFRTDVDPVTLEQRVGTTIRLTIDGLTNGEENSLAIASTDLEVARAADANYANNNRIERVDADPATEGERLAINVDLEKVGLAGDGGELIIGSMNKHEGNYWDAVNTVTDTTSGIEEFNVTVYGANDKSSSLSGLHSTNNNLRVVTVATDAALTGDSFADLTIGNSNTNMEGYDDLPVDQVGDDVGIGNSNTNMEGYDGYENALKDVQTFDASAFKGDLNLYAALTEEITAKYLDLQDQAPDSPTLDNVVFEYTGGTGNDAFHITLDANNEAFAGTATREDFVMSTTVAGGAGDDAITLAIVGNDDNSYADREDGDGLAYASFGPSSTEEVVANWYDNQKLLQNVRIDGGDGDDTLSKPGSGDVIIDGGAGNDTIYGDNTAAKATWVFNVEDATDSRGNGNAGARWDIDNLQSDQNNSYKLFKTDVVVNYKGFEVKAAIKDVNGVVTDLDINQAIKLAINSDPVLSKLLSATDGPANSLVIESLIDGEQDIEERQIDLYNSGELSVTLEGPTAAELTAGDVNQLRTWYGAGAPTTAADFATFFGVQAAVFNNNVDGTYNQVFGMDNGISLVGANSLHTTDNVITPGLGNDVVVLATGRMSNETVVYEGFGNGDDTIVNFSTDAEGRSQVVMVGESQDTYESFTVTFPTLTASAGTATIAFSGTTVSLANWGLDGSVRPAVDVAHEFVLGFSDPDWYATWVEGTAQVNFVRAVPGNLTPNVAATDFVFANVGTAAVTISNNVDGTVGYVAPVASAFTMDLAGSAAIADGTFAFTYDIDGAGAGGNTTVNIAYKAGDGPITLAGKVATALNAGNDWDAVDNGDGTVSISAVVPRALDINTYVVTPSNAAITAADVNGLEASINIYSNGLDQVGTAGELITIESMPLDYLDFSDYDAVGVVVNGVLVAGTTATAGQEYVLMTELATNAGEYKVEVYTEGATDVLVGVVGNIDFGATQDFVSQNFIL